MRPVSNTFIDVLSGSHKMVCKAIVTESYQTGANPVGTEVPINNGVVSFAASADIRGNLDVTFADPSLWPAGHNDLLAPYGNEIYIMRGVEYGNGNKEFVGLGYYRINSVEQAAAPRGSIRIAGQDRMVGIVEARLLAPVQFFPGDSVQDAFEALILDVYPDAQIEFDFNASASIFIRTHVADEDRYRFLRDIARSRGKIMYWDYRGVLRVESPPDPNIPVWDVQHGPNGVLVEMDRQISRDGVFNAVAAFGEGADTEQPVRAIARDMNPNSPTFYDGRFGKVSRFYSSPFITTFEQAGTAARALLQQSLGMPYSLDLTSVPNAALEVNDPVRVRYTNSKPAELHLIDSMDIPLDAHGAMRCETREYTEILIEVDE